MLACFILFIEQTILVAGISGVHTIGTTGQLIPFIVGIASMAVAKRELLMLLLKKVSVPTRMWVSRVGSRLTQLSRDTLIGANTTSRLT